MVGWWASAAKFNSFLNTQKDVSSAVLQSPGGRWWEPTLLDTAATPDAHLSPTCPASCPVTWTVLRSKQSLNFTHYLTQTVPWLEDYLALTSSMMVWLMAVSDWQLFGLSEHHFGWDWNISTATGLIGRKSRRDIHGPHRTKLTDFSVIPRLLIKHNDEVDICGFELNNSKNLSWNFVNSCNRISQNNIMLMLKWQSFSSCTNYKGIRWCYCVEWQSQSWIEGSTKYQNLRLVFFYH